MQYVMIFMTYKYKLKYNLYQYTIEYAISNKLYYIIIITNRLQIKLIIFIF